MSRAKSNWPMRGQHLSHCLMGSLDFLRDRSREGHVIMYSTSRDVNFFHWQHCAKPRLRSLHVTTRYCVGQTRMYTFLYPYMGIVSRDNVHNVKVNVRVRRAYTYSDVHIWLLYTHVTMYTMLALLRGSFTVHVYDRKYHIHIWAREELYTMFTARVMYMAKTITSEYGSCIDTSQTSTTLDTRTCLCTLYTMLTIVRECTRPLMLT